MPDHIFPHLAAAVDPPEVVVDLRPRLYEKLSSVRGAVPASGAENGLRFQQVRVLRQEAVGMYEVAVLEAGSAAALKRWMDDHGYKYPKGMDKACEDYVDDGWCFVAVKTKVSQKQGVDPQPGQRAVNAKLPDGSVFDGAVQGMGFRFRTDKLVVPMRLSSFNAGELRNVVYLLTDGPKKIRAIPEEYVVRQLTGEQLIHNVTDPLPLRIIGGTEKDSPDWQRKTLPQQRDPAPHNAAAKDLFASDLLAVGSGQLSLPHEETEKELLRIGDRLGLRGAEIDQVNSQALAEARQKINEKALKQLAGMTLTVVDGDFPREVLGRANLTFAQYQMPARRNTPQAYDAKTNAPAGKQDGILKLGRLERRDPTPTVSSVATANVLGSSWTLGALALVTLAGIFVASRRTCRT